MTRPHRFCPRFECLERREVPASLLTFTPNSPNAGALTVGGTAINTAITITGVNTNADTFIDQLAFNDGGPLANQAITASLVVNLTAITAPSLGLTFNLGGLKFPGNVNITLPSTTGNVTVAIANGTIAGNALATPATNGSVAISTGTSPDLLRFDAVTINGNISANTGTNTLTSDSAEFINGATVGGNVTIINANALTFGNATPSSIGGNLNFDGSLKSFGGTVAFSANSTVEGNSTISTGTGADNYAFAAGSAVMGRATINMGNGVNTFALNAGAAFYSNLTLTGGLQRDDINFAAGSFVLGNLTVNMGGAGNTVPTGNSLILAGDVAGSSVAINGGNGIDTVLVANTAVLPGAYLTANLLGGNDSFALNALVGRAVIDGGAGLDTFTTTLFSLSFPIAIRNFP